MSLIEVSLESLRHLDEGRISAAWNQELRHILMDMEDRPGDDRTRKVTLELIAKPIVDETGHLDTVQTQLQIGSKMPSRKTRQYSMKSRRVKNRPQLVYNEMSLDNVDQDTLPFDDPES